MTAKQRAARAKFKAVVAEAKKLRKKNPKLTQAQAVKQAFAISYSKAGKSKVGAVKKKAAPKKKAATKVKAKKRKSTEMHTDTKSHNVNIRVMSGIDDQMFAIRNNLEKSIDYYMQQIAKIQNAFGRLTPAEKIQAKKIIKRHKTTITKLLKQLRETNALIAKNVR
jgi:hypothetical protein